MISWSDERGGKASVFWLGNVPKQILRNHHCYHHHYYHHHYYHHHCYHHHCCYRYHCYHHHHSTIPPTRAHKREAANCSSSLSKKPQKSHRMHRSFLRRNRSKKPLPTDLESDSTPLEPTVADSTPFEPTPLEPTTADFTIRTNRREVKEDKGEELPSVDPGRTWRQDDHLGVPCGVLARIGARIKL